MDHLYCKLDERMRKNSRITECVVSQFVAVIDFQGFSMRQLISLNGIGNVKAPVRR